MSLSLQTRRCFISRAAILGCRGIFLIVFLSGLLPVAVNAQDDQAANPTEVIKVYSNLVTVPVIVSDRNGRYISGLREQDFKLYDNSAEQKLAYFDAAEAPLNVALLLDTSRSTAGVIDDIRAAAKNFLKDLRPQDRAMIVSFDYGVHKLSTLTSDRKVLERAIKDAHVGEYVGTLLNDALFDVIDRDLKPVTGRKAIVLLTDGRDAGSRFSEDEVLSYATESDAMIYSIYYEPAPMRGRDRDRPFRRRGGIFGGRGGDRFPGQGGPRAQQRRDRQGLRGEFAIEYLTRLSEVSAGRFYESETTDLKKTFGLIAEELRNQYRLGFYPDELARDGSLHQLKVKVNKADIAVRARTQYRAVELSGSSQGTKTTQH